MRFSVLRKLSLLLVAMSFTSIGFAFAKPVKLAQQGSFAAGGTVVQSAGTFDYSKPAVVAGQTLHGDHAYVFYQKPVRAKKYSLVFLHGAGQSAKTWETTPDGRAGFQNIFLSRGYSTYLIDQPGAVRLGRRLCQSSSLQQRQINYGSVISALATGPTFLKACSLPKTRRRWSNFFAR